VKKTGLILLAVIVVGLLAYLFLWPFEFQVKFKANTLPGDIIQTIRIWDRSLEQAEVISVDSLFGLRQNITWKDRSYVYDWNFEVINDSTTQVVIRITQPGRMILNKLLVPLSDQNIEQDASDIARTFYGILKEHLEITNVKVVGESEIGSLFCVCRTLKTSQVGKANGMMKDYGLLTSFISSSNLIPNGPPVIKVREWSHSSGMLAYDFCFPIVKTDLLPKSDSVAYKELRAEKVLKSVYHGNYITSDRAWYALISFAQANGYKTDGLPIEYFYNNPNLGLAEEDWKAEIFLPIK
jgi:effector-binding domain-containing protein